MEPKRVKFGLRYVIPLLYLIGLVTVFLGDLMVGVAILIGNTFGLVYLSYIHNKLEQKQESSAKQATYIVAIIIGLGFSVIGLIGISSDTISAMFIFQFILGLLMLAVGLWNLVYGKKGKEI